MVDLFDYLVILFLLSLSLLTVSSLLSVKVLYFFIIIIFDILRGNFSNFLHSWHSKKVVLPGFVSTNKHVRRAYGLAQYIAQGRIQGGGGGYGGSSPPLFPKVGGSTVCARAASRNYNWTIYSK